MSRRRLAAWLLCALMALAPACADAEQEASPRYIRTLLFGDVYPFIDLSKLMDIVEWMREEGQPYALMVMPIYDNASSPAMARFCDVLRYAQSLGAAIVLRAPLSRAPETEGGQRMERLALSFEHYAGYGVYPLALAVPENDLRDQFGRELLAASRTLLTLPREDAAPITEGSMAYAQASGEHQIIAAVHPGAATTARATALYLNVDAPLSELKNALDLEKRSVTPLASLRALSHAVDIGDHHLRYAPDTGLIYDGAPDALRYQPMEDDQTERPRDDTKAMAERLEPSGRGALFFALGACALLLLLIVLLRRQIRRLFLRPSTHKGGDGA